MSAREIDKVLKGLPLSDKIGALICSLSSQNKDAIPTIKLLIAVAAVMGKNLDDEFDRLHCAKAIRECATEVREYVPLVRE